MNALISILMGFAGVLTPIAVISAGVLLSERLTGSPPNFLFVTAGLLLAAVVVVLAVEVLS